MNRLDLRRILRMARAGDTSRAWRTFAQIAGAEVESDYDLVNMKARLLKDRAVASRGAERDALLMASRDAYLLAARLRRATYPLINAAAVERLAGNLDQARELAAATLDLLDQGDHEPDTAYWLAATRAEAALHTGSTDQARDLLRRAIALAPHAWEDHASTLRQFRLLLGAIGEGDDWLEAFSPPSAIHFGGMIQLASNLDQTTASLAAKIEQIGCGFAYGALAAGADILIAEMLVDRGAELHLVLPTGPDIFRQQSVLPFGDGWDARYDRLLDHCASITVVSEAQTLSSAAVVFATQVAMGSAMCQARALGTRAVALRLSDQAGGRSPEPDMLADCDRAWQQLGLPLHRVLAPRSTSAVAEIPSAQIAAILVGMPDRPGGVASSATIAPAPPGGYQHHDLTTAARLALRTLATEPALRLGIAAGPIASDADRSRLVETAGLIASAAAAGQLLVSRPVGLALLLVAPELRCEPDQDLSTPWGEIPVWQVSSPARDE